MKIHVKTYVVVYHDENTCNDNAKQGSFMYNSGPLWLL